MSIALPAGLPARPILLAEGVDVVAHDSLSSWGRRPLRLCLVNLMPNKPVTETQIARLVGSTSIPVDLTLCLPDGYRSKSLPEAHRAFYRPWSDISHQAFDALIVTGSPIEALAFEEVDYWSGLSAILDWARSCSIAGLYICWAAQAALYRYHGVSKRSLPQKMFGIYRQRVICRNSRLLKGFGTEFPVPVSRHTEVCVGDLPVGAGLSVLAASAESGLCLVEDQPNRVICMFNHLEYDAGTLREEYLRDRMAGNSIALPRNYFPSDDPRLAPPNNWRPFGRRLIANWLDEVDRWAQARSRAHRRVAQLHPPARPNERAAQ
jgi:homoserine O-succinyltransferase